MYVADNIKEMFVYAGKMLFPKNGDAFIKNFKRNVIYARGHFKDIQVIKNYYSELIKNRKIIKSGSPGAGSRHGNKKISISDYARQTSVSFKRGKLLAHIAAHYKPEVIVELGTSLGISTMFLSGGSPDSRIITIEGNFQIADLAEAGFKKFGYKNVKVIRGMFDDVIGDIISETGSSFMVFIDGNHTYDATINYFTSFAEAFLIIIDDIRWSKGMIRAWNEIRNNSSFTFIDLYSTGIIIKGGTLKQYSLWPVVI